MVSKALQTISKAEKEIEHMVNQDGQQDPSEQALNEVRRVTEQAAFSAIRATENWGKKALEKTKDFTEDITI